MIDDVVTDAAITTDQCGEFDLGANTVGGGNEHRAVHLLKRGGIEETTERTNAREHRFYKAGTSDLNGEGRQELLVHVVGPMACGTGGCPTLLFTPEGAGYTLVSTISVSRPPVRVSPRSSNGWRNLIVEISGGGGRSGHAELAYTGRGYPQNPTVAPARRITDLAGSEIVIDEFASFDAATPLPPG